MAAAGDTARERVIGAAVELFSEHGVQGTSLRMIADRLGVAKGAVYYQFPCKDDIVLALLQPLFDGISTLVGVAETCPPQDRREVAITGLVDLAIAQRRSTCLFRRDPAVDALITRHDRLRMLADRLHTLLLGPEPDAAARVALSVAVTGLYYCTTDPALRDVGDTDLHRILRRRFAQCVSVPTGAVTSGRLRSNDPREPEDPPSPS